MAGQVSVDWPTCDQDDCLGVRLATGNKCLAHATDEDREAALEQFSQTGAINASGVTISTTLLERILERAPRDPDDSPTLTSAWFWGATFQGDAKFVVVTFQGDAKFVGATFQGTTRFNGANFQHEAVFNGATFQEYVSFAEATFQGDIAKFNGATFSRYATFTEATFHDDAEFNGSTFNEDATFSGATFQGEARFNVVTFQGPAVFSEATFQHEAHFGGGTFQGPAEFSEVDFQREAHFGGGTFDGAQYFGPLLARRGLELDGAQFTQPVQIDVSTIGLSCRLARFPSGVQFRLRWASVMLDDTDLSVPSLLTGSPLLGSDKMTSAEQQHRRGMGTVLCRPEDLRAAEVDVPSPSRRCGA